ncbi:hypothetical protein OG413_46155 [Streptomyces sp. NBC_01433]|uniref:hypothetical protein n=1 Tax=Streptomyces sp. NBC_01433 TaxID=2903864 RepID=UPI0022560AAA|nr:hypothetical protein [Streptomyces sp. NBC_01433]MCX4682571.1 hypothetical protein [Streptomyces sp. NBC_01433]
MTSTTRLDSLTASGTNHIFDRIRLADGHALTLKTRPGADMAEEVFLFPGLTAPDTEAWGDEDSWEGWLTGGGLDGGPLYLDVPVEAVRELIEQHGGEHDDQEGDVVAPDATGGTDGEETAEVIATRALAAWGIAAHQDDDAGNTWLVIGRDQTRRGFPRMLTEPYVVLYLYNDTDADEEEITVTRAPRDGDRWHLLAGDGLGAERELMTPPADRLAECVEAIAEWVTDPLPTAGSGEPVEGGEDGDPVCEGHSGEDDDLLRGVGIGETTYCDGLCKPHRPRYPFTVMMGYAPAYFNDRGAADRCAALYGSTVTVN